MRTLVVEQILQQLFQRYTQAFLQYDIPAVINCYAFPCVLSTPDKMVVLNNTTDAENEFGQIFTWMKQANASQIAVSSASYHLYSDSLAVVNILWKFIDDKAEVLAEFAALYHIHIIEKQAKIMQVVSHETAISVDLANTLTLLK